MTDYEITAFEEGNPHYVAKIKSRTRAKTLRYVEGLLKTPGVEYIRISKRPEGDAEK